MHEATLAENILNIALEAAKQNQAAKIFKIGLTLGEMAGVEELAIKRVPISAVCNKCGKIFQLESYNFFCPACDGVLILQSGRELLVDFVDCE